MTDFARLMDELLGLFEGLGNSLLNEGFDEPPLWAGISRGEGDFLDVSLDGEAIGGGNETIARYRVTVERVHDGGATP